MSDFWDGFHKEANIAGGVLKGVTKAPKGSIANAGESVLNYAKMNAPKPRATAANTLDYGAMNNARKAEKGINEAASGTLSYAGGTPKVTQQAQAIPRPPAAPKPLDRTAQARIQNATKGGTNRTDWNEALQST
jgi:hypothetical protein